MATNVRTNRNCHFTVTNLLMMLPALMHCCWTWLVLWLSTTCSDPILRRLEDIAIVPRVDILLSVPIHHSVLVSCMGALIRHEASSFRLQQRIIFAVTADGYSPKSISYLSSLCRDESKYVCLLLDMPTATTSIEDAVNRYTELIRPTPNALVVLSPYAVVTSDWLSLLYSSLYTTPHQQLDMVGPLSNYAGLQSVPSLTESLYGSLSNESSMWSSNHIPPGLSVDTVSRSLQVFARQSNARPIPIPRLNDLCIMLKYEVLLRGLNATRAIFVRSPNRGGSKLSVLRCAVVPSVYIYSLWVHRDRNKLVDSNAIALDDSTAMQTVRGFVGRLFHEATSKYSHLQSGHSVLFVLHDVAVGGGIVSILQESLQMLKYGVSVAVSVPASAAKGQPMPLIQAMLPNTGMGVIKSLIRLHGGSTFYPHPYSADFNKIAQDYDIIVATYCMTMFSVEKACTLNATKMPAYYVQDYEPWTWDSPFAPSSDPNNMWVAESRRSYIANEKRTFMIAKTKWTAQMVHKHHSLPVHRVVPSLDHEVYFPNQTELDRKLSQSMRSPSSVFRILAMIRPTTPRRNPELTLEVALRLAHEFGERVEVLLFGSKREDMLETRARLEQLKGSSPHRSSSFFSGASNVSALSICSVSHINPSSYAV